MKTTIKTPSPQQYVELESRFELGVVSDGGLRVYQQFHTLLLVKGGLKLRLRVDEEVPQSLLGPVPPFGFQRSVLVVDDLKQNDRYLDEEGWIEFRVHVSSPVIPRERGMWIRLKLEYDPDKGGLHIDGGAAMLSVGQAWVPAGGKPPAWLGSAPDAVWALEDGGDRRELSRGNALLSAQWDQNGAPANLVHIDPGVEGHNAGDYSFGLQPYSRTRGAVVELCPALTVSPGFGGPALLSDYALLLGYEARASVPLIAHSLKLLSEPVMDQNGQPSAWSVQWLEVPGATGSRPRHSFSLESFSQLHLGAHAFGLATTRARNRLSMVPTWIATTNASASCDMQFHVRRRGLVAADTRLRQVFFRQPTEVILTSGGALDVAGEPMRWIAIAAAGHPDRGMERGAFLDWKLETASKTRYADVHHRFGVGSVLVDADGDAFAEGSLVLRVSPEAKHYRRGPLEAKLELQLSTARLSALSMDPEIGFETLSSVVRRPRPWTVDLEGGHPGRLTIAEHAQHDQSRLLRLSLTMDRPEHLRSDVVLVDTSPFTIVRVQTDESLEGGGLYAEYLDDADQAPEWRFYSESGRMVAVLPPQGIGEEMVKGHLRMGDEVVPAPGKLFDFRLTPNAILVLDRTDIDTARSEAPWSLRRLLARRSGTTGVKLVRARYELLYGMQAWLEAPGLRIAELEGFVGRVPYPEALWKAYQRQQNGDTGPRENYAKQVADWQTALWHRPSWWRVYRDVTDRRNLLLDSGVTYSLRESRQSANPFTIAKHATAEGAKLDAGRPPMRGGVDWPFQSRNVYSELLAKPQSSSGSVEGLVFGSLGGEGAQTAAFNNGKTLIISNTRQGRLDSLTLIRVGRIAMTWNKARHVIVYERTTRRAPRYDYPLDEDGHDQVPDHDDLEMQPPFPGIAALRKVREYVEITEARRHYPDSATQRPAAGPLVQCAFGTTVIPVMSSWGRDVREGFAIALRGPIPKGKEAFFPDPQVFMDFARAQGKGGGAISQRVTSTERLVFFSSTRDVDGGDTDQWPAWPDIDFPAIAPPPAPPLPYRSGFRGRRQPDAEAVDPLMARFTFELARSEEGANLMHGRNSEGIEAKIANINLARGLPPREDMSAEANVRRAQLAADSFSQSRAVMLDGLRDLAFAARDRAAANGSANVREDAQFRKELDSLMQELRVAASKAPDLSGVGEIDWAKQQEQRAKAYEAGVKAEGISLRNQLTAQIERMQAPSAQLAEVRLEAAALANALTVQARERLGTYGLVGAEALMAGQGFMNDWISTSSLRLKSLADTSLGMLSALEQQIAAEPARLGELEAIWRERVARMPQELEAILATLARLTEGAAGRFFSQVVAPGQDSAKTLEARVRAALEPVFRGTAQWLARWLESIAPFEAEMPDFQRLRSDLITLLDPQAIALPLKELADEFAGLLGGLGTWDEEIQRHRRELDAAARKLQQDIAQAVNIGDLTKLLENEAKEIEGRISKAALDVVNNLKLESSIQDSLTELQGTFDALNGYGSQVEASIDTIAAQINGTFAELDAAVHAQLRQVEASLQAGARQLEDWASKTIDETWEIGKRSAGATLEAVRLFAEAPVTQGLVAARQYLAYRCEVALDTLGLTPTSAMFNDMGQEVLNALSANVPFDRLGERLLPRLGGMMVRDLFPDFCGIKLADLLPDLDIALDETYHYDWLTLQHGFHQDRLSAWARVSIHKRFEEDATLFDLGPIKLRLLEPLFHAVADIVYEDGRQRQVTSGRLQADFELSLNDKPMVTMAGGELMFDERGKLDFKFDSEKIELAPELNFISQALKALMPQVEGLTVTPLLPAGISAELTLPLPDIGTGAFTLTGVTLNAHMGLLVGDGFEIRTGLWLSKPDRPFGLAVLFLGGGGWFGIDASYKPPQQFTTRVSVGVSAGAFVALNFGFASGSAGLLFTAGIDFYRDWQTGSGTTAISLGLLMWGEFSIMGIASAGVRLMLRITYTDGGMTGTGTLSVKIKICWCYTLRVNRTVRKQFTGGGGGKQKTVAAKSTARTLVANAPLLVDAAATPSGEGLRAALDKVPAPPPPPVFDPAAAVKRYFDTLAI